MKRGILALLLAALLLAGCAKKPATEPTPEPTDAAPPVENTAPEPPPEVENNGGNYVRVGDTVYFRRYAGDALAKTALFGAFTDAWSVGGESSLMALDTATGALTELYTVTGAGPLWYGDGGFYLRESAGGETYTAWYAPDGSASEYVCSGAPLGVTEGGLLAVSGYDEDYHTVYAFYRDKAPVGSWETEDYLMTAGLTDDGLFLVQADYDSEAERVTERFRQIQPDGTALLLGERQEKDGETYYYDIQADRFLVADGVVTIGLGYYAGTGHFLNDAVFVEATVGRADSLKTIEKSIDIGDTWELPYLEAGAEGVAYLSEREGQLEVNWEDGSLRLWEGGAWQVLAEDFAPSRSGGWGHGQVVQYMDYVDGAAYVTLASVFASPADGFGWREADSLLAMRYMRVSRDGTVTELDCVDADAEIFGFVWFVEGAGVALWQQLTSEDGEGWFDVPYVYAVPIADDAYWDEAAFDGVTGLLPYDYGEGELDDYNGYPVPDAEPAGNLTLVLDRDGVCTAVLRKDPAAVLNIDFDLSEAELSGAAAKLPIERRDSDEDTPWYWTRLTALENGVHVRIERTPDAISEPEALALAAGLFVAGETLYDGTLRRGEYIALRASLPWHPELRVSVDKDGEVGAYVFGEDNYLHMETEDSPHPGLTLAVYPLPDTRDYGGEGLKEALNGAWTYRSPVTGEIEALLCVLDGRMTLSGEGAMETAVLDWSLDRLYSEEWQTPDLLCLRSDDPTVLDAMHFSAGGVGDYKIELYRTDGEELLRLTQANNGDGAFGALLPDKDGAWRYDFVFSRERGVGETGARRRGTSFPAMLAKYDVDAGVCWLREAELIESEPALGDVWRAKPASPCLAYPIAPEAASGLGEYPMALRRVTTDMSGAIVKAEEVE